MSLRMIRAILYVILFGLFLFQLATRAQDIREEVNLVTVPVTVMTIEGRLFTGLQAEHFRVFEDGKEQEILHCSIDDAPISVGIVFDRSGSMGEATVQHRKTKEEMAIAALAAFTKESNLKDEFSLVTFADRAEVLVNWTDNPNDLMQSMVILSPPKGRTAFIDAVYLSASLMKQAKHSRRAILIITDGGDNHSRYTERDVKRILKETDIQLFAIGLFDFDPMSQLADARTIEELKGPTLLAELTDLSGGVAYNGTKDPNLLIDLAAHIGRALRDQYTLSYRPSQKTAHDGKYHHLKVKIRRLPRGTPELIPFARYGYTAAK